MELPGGVSELVKEQIKLIYTTFSLKSVVLEHNYGIMNLDLPCGDFVIVEDVLSRHSKYREL